MGDQVSVRITNQSVTKAPGQEPVIVVHDTIFKSGAGKVNKPSGGEKS